MSDGAVPQIEEVPAFHATPTQKASKKERTEAQRAATLKMQEKRKAKLALGEEARPDALAVADVWYSNHTAQKETRRRAKKKEMEEIISGKLDSYHEKLMGELAKPLETFLDRYIDDRYEEAPIRQRQRDLSPQRARAEEIAEVEPAAVASKTARNDFSRFF